MLIPPAVVISGDDSDNVIYGNSGAYNELQGNGGNDLVVGGAIEDWLYGGSGDDQIYGEAGNDLLQGGGGADYLQGGDGADTVLGGAGNDYISGGRGNDLLTGGAGRDSFVFAPGDGLDVVTDFRIYEDSLFYWSGDWTRDSLQIAYDGYGARITFRIDGQVQCVTYLENIARNSLAVFQDEYGISVA